MTKLRHWRLSAVREIKVPSGNFDRRLPSVREGFEANRCEIEVTQGDLDWFTDESCASVACCSAWTVACSAWIVAAGSVERAQNAT
jgi:hypothetical protein